MKGKTILLVTLGLAVAGGVVYAIDRYKKRKKPPVQSLTDSMPCGVQNDNVQTSPFKLFKVSTLVTDLNVRQGPGINTPKIGSVGKGDQVYARPTCYDNWYEYSTDGTARTGYVYSSYLDAV